MSKNIFLTKKTAKALIKQELGITVTNLETDTIDKEIGVYIYKFQLAQFSITVQNDWSDQNGLYSITISRSLGLICLYFNPEMLTRILNQSENGFLI